MVAFAALSIRVATTHHRMRLHSTASKQEMHCRCLRWKNTRILSEPMSSTRPDNCLQSNSVLAPVEPRAYRVDLKSQLEGEIDEI